MTLAQIPGCQDILAWIVKYLIWILIFLLGMAFLISWNGHAATLSISGSAVGNGSQLFQVVGENITAFWDGFRWNVTGAF